MRELSKRTRSEYDAILKSATRSDGMLDLEKISTWSRSRVIVLRAALTDLFLSKYNVESRADLRPEEAEELREYLRYIPRPKRRSEPFEGIPESKSIELLNRLREYPPGRRALILLPIYLGFRAEELLTLTREQCEAAIESGVIEFTRKGGKRMKLPVRDTIKDLFQELLNLPSAHGANISKAPKIEAKWEKIQEILSPGKYVTAYHLYNKLVHRLTGEINLRPHKLRHEFATRLVRDGVSLVDIQAALGHRSINTTMLYVHGDAMRLKDKLLDF